MILSLTLCSTLKDLDGTRRTWDTFLTSQQWLHWRKSMGNFIDWNWMMKGVDGFETTEEFFKRYYEELEWPILMIADFLGLHQETVRRRMVYDHIMIRPRRNQVKRPRGYFSWQGKK